MKNFTVQLRALSQGSRHNGFATVSAGETFNVRVQVRNGTTHDMRHEAARLALEQAGAGHRAVCSWES